MPVTNVFPTLKCCMKLGDERDQIDTMLYDVKFYPYATRNNEQVFAAAGDRHVFICRANASRDTPVEVLRYWEDEHEGASLNSVIWTQDPTTSQPWLCVAGKLPKHIQVLDAESASVVRILAGHGRAINDLAVSPLSTNILASASEDYTVRLWNLDPKFENQPCVAILGGGAHDHPFLAVHFHPNGKWLLTGGMDTAVALWSVPSLEELNNRGELSEPSIAHYPYFYSSEVHPNYVDNVQFYGDLIISRDAKDPQEKRKAHQILIWRIDGFDSEAEPPEKPPVPQSNVLTRTCFEHEPSSRGFQRLLTLDMPNTDRFYLRFGLLDAPNMRPILAMGNQESRISFWDLQRLDEGMHPAEEGAKRKRKAGARGKATAEGPSNSVPALGQLDRIRQESVDSGSTPKDSSASSPAPEQRKYTLNDPFAPIKPHHTLSANTSLSSRHFATAQMAWSPDGTWLVGVGDGSMMCIFHRDASVVNGVPKE